MAGKQDTAGAALEGLRQIGSGWHLSVATAIARGDHKALGMDRKQFASEAGGFKLTDSRQAILDLHDRKLSQQAIADVLGVDRATVVSRVLYDEGRIETLPKAATRPFPQHRKGKAAGTPAAGDEAPAGTPADTDGTADDFDELIAERDRLAAEAEEARIAAKQARDDAREEVKQRTKDLREELAKFKKEAKQRDNATLLEGLAPEDRERLRKENEAAVAEEVGRWLQAAAPGIADGVVANLELATTGLRQLISDQALEGPLVALIEGAADEFNHELRVARAAVNA